VPGLRSEGSLVRAVGVWGLAARMVNITIGGGIFRLPAAAADALGSAAPLAYLVCAVAMALIVLCFAEAGSRVSLTGGVYAYVEVAFGPLAGFLTGVMMWAGITVATAAVSSLFADAVVALIPALAPWRGSTIAVVLCALAALNVAGVRGANRFVSVMTVAKLLPLLLLIVTGFAAVHGEYLVVERFPAPTHLARAAAISIFAFLGIETALVPGGEVRDPARTVPRAIALGMATVTIVYLAVQLIAQGILGPALAGQKTPLAEAAAVSMGAFGRALILVGMTLSMFVYLSGMTLAVPRTLYAFARDGFLPAPLAAVHGRFHTPHVAIIVQTILVIALAVSGSFEKLVIVSNGSVLLVYAACCLAVVNLRRMGVRGDGEPFRMPFARLVPILAFAVIVWILSTLSPDEWKSLLVIAAVAVVIFAASMPNRRAQRSSEFEGVA
jgi:APA family basic amino acid/polyamine antiporter